jgi:hypothetical protein
MRVYLPATVPLLRDWLTAGSATAVGPAYAVTPTLREWYREGDIEELEHAASLLAAVGSLTLLADDVAAPPRRVVLAADVDEARTTQDLEHRGAVRLAGAVPRDRWSSALVDDDGAAAVVAAAVELLRDPAADATDIDFALGEAEAADLGWYAVQELPFLLG